MALKSSHLRSGCHRSHLMLKLIADIPVGGKSPCQLNVVVESAHILMATFNFSMPPNLRKVFI